MNVTDSTADAKVRGTPDSGRLISIAAYRSCHGLWQLWSVVCAALPPPKVCDVEFEPTVTEAAELAKITMTPSYFSPPTPPPRS